MGLWDLLVKFFFSGLGFVSLWPVLAMAADAHLDRAGQATYTMQVHAGMGQFLTVLRIGTPPVSFTAIIDTGSDLVWRQCKPCQQCYPQSAFSPFPIFNPSLSSTYRKASCSDPLCKEAQLYGSSCNRTCKYNSPYDDPPAYTRGDLAFDTLSISDKSGRSRKFAHFAFGCSHESHGPYNFAGAGGIVGFGQGKLSLPAQLGIKKFSYCLPRIEMWRISGANDTSLSSKPSAWILAHKPKRRHYPLSPPLASTLILGEDAMLSGNRSVQSTHFLPAVADDFSYYVQLEGISVGGRHLNISPSVFRHGGTIIDSGTTFTTLAPRAFRAVYAAFIASIAQKPTHTASPRNLSLCYSSLPRRIPSLSFHFRGAQIDLPTNNYFIHIDNLFCLAILESHDAHSVYGNVQQQDFHILYDLHTRLISFKPSSCFLQQ